MHVTLPPKHSVTALSQVPEPQLPFKALTSWTHKKTAIHFLDALQTAPRVVYTCLALKTPREACPAAAPGQFQDPSRNVNKTPSSDPYSLTRQIWLGDSRHAKTPTLCPLFLYGHGSTPCARPFCQNPTSTREVLPDPRFPPQGNVCRYLGLLQIPLGEVRCGYNETGTRRRFSWLISTRPRPFQDRLGQLSCATTPHLLLAKH